VTSGRCLKYRRPSISSWPGGTSDDVPHLSERAKAELLDSTPEYQRQARSKGIPVLGSGLVFPVDEASIKVPAFKIPAFWPQITGIDFGYDHPFGAGHCAWDRDADIWYVVNVYRERLQTPVVHAAAVKAWGWWLPVAWPHDGLQHDKGSGEELAKQYKAQGLHMLRSRATFEDGGNGLEAGVTEMLDRMKTGRFKVFDHLSLFFEEFRLYHRKDGKIVKVADDIISAARYALMMKRKAIVKPMGREAKTTPFEPLDRMMGS